LPSRSTIITAKSATVSAIVVSVSRIAKYCFLAILNILVSKPVFYHSFYGKTAKTKIYFKALKTTHRAKHTKINNPSSGL
jgi:hypothetical protein